jgi:hypothetical protein
MESRHYVVSFSVVYIQTTFDAAVGPVTFFFNVVLLTDATASVIVSADLGCLHKHKLTDNILIMIFCRWD